MLCIVCDEQAEYMYLGSTYCCFHKDVQTANFVALIKQRLKYSRRAIIVEEKLEEE